MRVAYRCKKYNEALARAYISELTKRHRDELTSLWMITLGPERVVVKEGYYEFEPTPDSERTAVYTFTGGARLIISPQAGLRCVGSEVDCGRLFSGIIADVMKGNWTRSEPGELLWEDSLPPHAAHTASILRVCLVEGVDISASS